MGWAGVGLAGARYGRVAVSAVSAVAAGEEL